MARIAIIGGGRMGAQHIRAAHSRGHEIAAVVDPMPDCASLGAFPDLRGVWQGDEGLLTPDAIDLAVIATTADAHIPLLRSLAARGFGRFVVEKPFSRSLDEAVSARDAAMAVGARVVVNHGRRYDPAVKALKALDESGRHGRLRAVFIRTGAGGLGSVGTHWIDLCNNLFAALPEQVSAVGTVPASPNPRGDHFDDPGMCALLGYPGARRAVIDVGDDVGIVGGAEFLFDFAQISWTRERDGWRFLRRRDEDLERLRSDYGLPLVEDDFGVAGQDIVAAAAYALDDALADGPPISGMAEAIDTMHVFAACRIAAAEGKTVALPLSSVQSALIYPIP